MHACMVVDVCMERIVHSQVPADSVAIYLNRRQLRWIACRKCTVVNNTHFTLARLYQTVVCMGAKLMYGRVHATENITKGLR